MKASVLFGAGWENDSQQVLWRDAGRAFCRLMPTAVGMPACPSFPTPCDVVLEKANRNSPQKLPK